MRKFASALAIFISTQVLAYQWFHRRNDRFGLSKSRTARKRTVIALRILVGVVPAIMLFLSIFVAWRYPLNRVAHGERVLEQLAINRANVTERIMTGSIDWRINEID